MFSPSQALYVYNVARKWFTLGSVVASSITLFIIDAPFGRFTPSSQHSIFLFDGVKTWIFMELFSPLCFILSFSYSPLSHTRPHLPHLFSPQTLLTILYLTHYANRALISPLRTPSRSKSHIIVPMSGVTFNILNGALMGSYLSSPAARIFLGHKLMPYLSSSQVQLGLVMWVFGFVGNVFHDEILLDIRRKARKGKARDDGNSHISRGEHYGIPSGWLYKYISYPNYFCEWIEWIGFALAAAPLPLPLATLFLSLNSSSLSTPPTSLVSSLISLPFHAFHAVIQAIASPATHFSPSLTPPWIFVINEILLMLPRALSGHRWYHQHFGVSYPQERRAVIPFLI